MATEHELAQQHRERLERQLDCPACGAPQDTNETGMAQLRADAHALDRVREENEALVSQLKGLAAAHSKVIQALALADALAAKVMELRADQNSWPKEEEVYAAMVEYRAARSREGHK